MQKTNRGHTEVNMARDNGTSAAVSKAVPHEDRIEFLNVPVMVGPTRISLKLIQNRRGRFAKLIFGHKTITVHESGIHALRARIGSLIIVLGRLPRAWKSSGLGAHGQGTHNLLNEALHTERFISKGHKFYLDLYMNETGVLVRISQVSMHRTTVFFPASALGGIHVALSKVDERARKSLDFEKTSARTISRVVNHESDLPTVNAVGTHLFQKELALQGVCLVFEKAKNMHGCFLRISEKGGKSRPFVTLPYSAITQVINILKEAREAENQDAQEVLAQNSLKGVKSDD